MAIAAAERAGNGATLEATASGSNGHAVVIVDVVHDKTTPHYRESLVDGLLRSVKTAAGTD
ncbi:MAG: hypothetical protein ABIY40_05530 [Rhodanobacteraceae bacterium]|nr:hypothetical protein [Pseudomonadota bacterium]